MCCTYGVGLLEVLLEGIEHVLQCLLDLGRPSLVGLLERRLPEEREME